MSVENQLKHKIIKANIKTLKSSSVHAIPNIIKNKFNSIKVVWTIFFLTSSGFCAWFIYKSISDYLSFDVVTNIQINYANKIKFPMISICLISNGNIKFLNEILLNCIYNNQNCDLANDFELYHDPILGLCFRYNSGKNMSGKSVEKKYNYGKGEFYSLNLELFMGNSESNYKSGFKIYITDGKVDSFNDVGLSISTGILTTISINKYQIITQPKPYGDCIKDLKSVDSYESECYKKSFSNEKMYTFYDCANMCLQKFVGEKCGFQVIELGKSYYNQMKNQSFLTLTDPVEKNCAVSILLNFKNSTFYLDNCDCPVECESFGYTYTLSYANYPTDSYANFIKNDRLMFKNLSQDYTLDNFKKSLAWVDIQFEEMKETVIKQEIKTQLSDLISNIGGTLGLFLGFLLYI